MSLSPQTFYDRVAPLYDATYNGDRLAGAENALVTALIRAAGCDRGRVLELACGTGAYLEHSVTAPARYLGTDISAGMLREARRKHPAYRFCQADFAALPLRDACVDSAICLFGSFSYAARPEAVVAELARVLAPGGRFFVMAVGPRAASLAVHQLDGTPVAVPWRTLGARELRDLFEGFRQLRGRAIRCAPDPLLRWLPGPLALAARRLEALTVGLLAPDRCYSQIVTGVR
jgi:ubiquinone/menaquinone biosynthesis C-methylase UbiE